MDFVAVFISWLNLDIGFDSCFFLSYDGTTFNDKTQPQLYKAPLWLPFPTYVIILVAYLPCNLPEAKIGINFLKKQDFLSKSGKSLQIW